MKQRTNVSIDKALFDSAKEKKLVLSAILEKALKIELQKIEQEKWISENKISVQQYTKYISENGVFSEDDRVF